MRGCTNGRNMVTSNNVASVCSGFNMNKKEVKKKNNNTIAKRISNVGAFA